MATLKIVRSNRLQDRRTGRGETVTLVRAHNPIQKKQWVKATATLKPATFTEKAVIETELFYLPFMEAIQKAQARWPGKAVSYQTLEVTAAKKQEAAPAVKAE